MSRSQSKFCKQELALKSVLLRNWQETSVASSEPRRRFWAYALLGLANITVFEVALMTHSSRFQLYRRSCVLRKQKPWFKFDPSTRPCHVCATLSPSVLWYWHHIVLHHKCCWNLLELRIAFGLSLTCETKTLSFTLHLFDILIDSSHREDRKLLKLAEEGYCDSMLRQLVAFLRIITSSEVPSVACLLQVGRQQFFRLRFNRIR